ncbi:MAG: GNAT family N-acetyltransferase [Pricia sp.]|nr:GNAT family N-acetyltransferase [Pricia sp.]
MIQLIRADQKHIPILVPLFDAYRIFYGQESDLMAARKFLQERFIKNQSVVFMAFYETQAVGFVQLYPTFSSVSLEHYYILNDLYVNLEHRKKGIGQMLLNRAKDFCKENNGKGLALETAIDNPAQRLYEKLGWERDSLRFHYFWTIE